MYFGLSLDFFVYSELNGIYIVVFNTIYSLLQTFNNCSRYLVVPKGASGRSHRPLLEILCAWKPGRRYSEAPAQDTPVEHLGGGGKCTLILPLSRAGVLTRAYI